MQRQMFPQELAELEAGERPKGDKGRYAQLKLYLDEMKVIRLYGRLEGEDYLTINRPIMFAYAHTLTFHYILQRHRVLNHSSVTYTLNQLRNDIFSPKLRLQIKMLIKNCIYCQRFYSRPFKLPENPPLNDYRTNCDQPFSMVGVDFIGPFQLQTQDSTNDNSNGDKNKIYIVLFSCLVSRAIYLVLVDDRKTETFLRAFRELSARRNEPKLLISDNEGAFQAADKVLTKIANSERMAEEILEKNITWKFLPSRASWMGAVYERLVGLIKVELMKLQRNGKFTRSDWSSHIMDIEALINNRPLTYVTDADSEPQVITPNMILKAEIPKSTLATGLNIDKAIAEMREYQNNPGAVYKERVHIKTKFWKDLRQSYIMTLRESHYKATDSAGRYSARTPRVGNVVALYEVENKIGGRLGIITELLPSTDGQVRKARVRTTVPAKRTDIRKNLRIEERVKSINHLLPLELDVEEYAMEAAENDFSFEGFPDNQTQVPNDPNENEQTAILENTQQSTPSNTQNSVSINEHDSSSQVQEITEEEDVCMLPECLKPNFKRNIWVNCNGKKCKKWYHNWCIGLDPNKEYEGKTYTCENCKTKEKSNDKSTPASNNEIINSDATDGNMVDNRRPKRSASNKANMNRRVLISTGDL